MGPGRWLTREVTLPLYEWLCGRDTPARVALLREQVSLAPDAAAVLAKRLLRQQLRYASASLPFYREWLAGIELGVDGDPGAALAGLAPLTKAAIRAAGERMINRRVPGGVKPACTGGTTGDRLNFWVDSTYGAQNMAARLVMQERFGVGVGDRRVYLWGNPIEARGGRLKRWRDWAINERLLNAFDMGPADMDGHLATICQFRPRLIYGYPSALTRLAEHAAERLGAGDFDFLRVVIGTGEMLTDEHRATIRATFGCAVAAEYGAREVGLIAHECPAGGLHVLTPVMHVAIWKGGSDAETDGRFANVGEVGEVLCTTLNTRAQPLIHYRLGDLGALEEGACDCGLGLPLMRVVSGKILGFIALPDGRLCNGAITSHVLRDQPGIVHYRTHQHTLTRFTITMQVDERFSRATYATIHERYRRLFGDGVELDIRIVEHLPPDPSGKRRYVVSDVAPDYAGAEVVEDIAVSN